MKTIRYIFSLITIFILTTLPAWGVITPTTPSKDANGVYQIGTAEELWGFAQGINNGTIAVSANAKLTCETTIDLGGSSNGSFPGIGSSSKVYTGTFDGNGKTIKGFYRTITATGQGFFNYTGANAKIKDLTLEGEMTANNPGGIYGVGTLIGISTSTTITDVTSSVKMTLTNVPSGARIFGGLVGRATTSNFNRCRYKGLIDASGSTAFVDRIGGIIGDGSSTIENTLFDGEIKVGATTGIKIAGFAVQQNGAITIKNSLFAGKLTFPSTATVDDNSGPFAGTKGSSITVNNKSYYLSDGIKKGENAAYGYCTKGTSVGTTPWADITSTLNNNAVVGQTANWKIVEGQDYPIPMEYTIEAAGPYTITFDTKGGTPIDPIVQDYGTSVTAPADPTKTGYVFAGWDREIPTTMPGANITITAKWTYTPVDGYYLIGTKEDFFNFADVVNGNSTKGISANYAASAKLIDDVDLENTEFDGFGKNETDKFYTGTFDGQGHTISNFARTCTTSNGCGFFNAINNATVKDFTLEGNITFSFASQQYYNSSVVAYMTGNNSKIEDVHSKVNATMTNGNTRLYGGILGRGTGTVNRCRYSGTVSASTSYDQIAGICASANGRLTISNCLFDGSITSESTNANLCMGGIVAKTNQNGNTLSNNLVKGTISPSSNTYAYCGVVIGNASNTISMDRCYYVGVGTLPAVGTATQSTGTAILVDPSATDFKWIDICVALNNGSSNWGIQTETYPVPGDQAATTYTITFDSNGGSEVATISLPEGAAIVAPENPTWTGHTFTGWSPALPATMPAENITVTAQWELTSYNVNYYVDNTFYQAVPVKYTETINPLAAPTKARYTFGGWSGFPDGNIMPANDIRIDGTFTFSPNVETGVFEIGNQEDLFNFAAYVNATGLGNGNGHGNGNAKLIADISLDGTTPFPGLGKYVTYKEGETTILDTSYAYSGDFDGQGHKITGYVRNVITNTNQGGFFNYVNGATIKNFKLEGEMTISCNAGQQYGSVVGWSETGSTIEDVHSSVNVTITSTAAQVGGFTGRAGGTYNRCRYSGTVSTSTAYNKIGGFAGSLRAGTTTNCLFDGTLDISTSNDGLIAGGFTSSVIEAHPNNITNCLTHGTISITNKNAKCGIIFGYADKNIALTNALYTTTNATGLNAVGTATGATMTGIAKDVTSESWANITVMLNPTEGTYGNWEIKEGKDYPIPSKCTITGHVHSYRNGFCIADDGNYQEAKDEDSDGRYEVDNAGKLWWLVTKVNDGTLSKSIRIKLTTDIDMEGEARGSWPGFCVQQNNDWNTAFQGIFDGQGHTIRNYYSNNTSSSQYRRGFFNTVYNATIRSFTIEGTMIANNGTNIQGVVIGSASGTSTIEDITSTVNITTNKVQICGGVAGALENTNNQPLTVMNRCRYNGTITIAGNSNNTSIGGVVGELRSAIMTNSLFDGTITAGTDVAYSGVGGVVGKVASYDNSEMHRILSHGTISLTNYNAATNKSGIVVGAAEKTLYMYKCFHTKTNVSAGLDYIGPHIINKDVKNEDTGETENIPVEQLLGSSTDKTSNLSDLYSSEFRTTLGEPNWAAVSSGYTYPYEDKSHIHRFSNGFCTSGDGEYEKAGNIGNVYQIDNGGKLYWFATQFNAGNIAQDAEVQIMNNIDLEGNKYIYPGIGTEKRPFKGVFNGMGYKIQRYYRDIVNAERTGLINNAVGATIKDFSIYGETNFNLASIKNFHGTVLGMGINGNTQENPADTMLITDVHSFVNINCSNANVRVLGGIAGRTSGGVHRSRYGGTIKGIGETPSASGRQIAGIVANAREKILISDCLFDGKIWVTCLEAPVMRVSGILASNEKNSGVKITIKNCLFNGCLQLKHTYTEPAGTPHELQTYTENGKEYQDYHPDMKQTQNGIIAGYWDSNLPKIINNVYYLKTCEGMDEINIGGWEGKNQQAGSTVATTEIKSDNPDVWDSTTGKPKWNEIFQSLDEYKEVKDEEGNPVVDEEGNPVVERNGNWEYEYDPTQSGTGEETPIPGGHVCHHQNDDGSSAYDANGYCTICGKAKPLVQDTDGKYKMELVSDLASFRDMVNNGDLTEGTVLNAKLTADIDFANFDGDFGEPIGNSNFNRYLYNFDGQGYSLLNVKITTDDQYVGFFGFAGDETHDCYIHDLTITGEIVVPYKSSENKDKPMYMGVVGKMYRGKIENVHSRLTMKNTNATRAMIGGILGCAETAEGQEVIISKCSYIGACTANAVGSIGGIVGETSKNTKIENCTFAGTLYHSYEGENNNTQFGGIVGHNNEATFQGVKNCVVAGILNTNEGRVFVNYGTSGNHKNVLVGEDEYMNNLYDKTSYKQKFSGNYALKAYENLIPTNSEVKPTFYTLDKFISGQVCAELNAIDHTGDLNYSTYGLPFGQVLGFQIGANKTADSPAMAVPFPGYQNPEKETYRVVKDASKNYIADWYFFDDNGDTTPFPLDAASMKVKKIQYTRVAKNDGSNNFMGIQGYSSFCLPFDITKGMLPSNSTKCYEYKGVAGDRVQFQEITSYPIVKGTPFIMVVDGDVSDWTQTVNNTDGTEVALQVNNPLTLSISNGVLQSGNYNAGIYGSFDTFTVGTNYWKLKGDGSKLVKTKEDSHCYPYRAFLKLPTPNSANQASTRGEEYVPCFLSEGESIEELKKEQQYMENQHYNIFGHKVNAETEGIIIVNGKKLLKIKE